MKKLKGNPKNSCMGAFKDTLDIKLTDACNGNCGFCVENGGKLSNSVPVKTLIEKVKTINPKSVLVLGGEPFIYPHLVEFIEGISGREIFLTTNGSGLKNKDIVEKIAPHLKAINISLMHFSMDKHFELTNVRLNPTEIKESIEILHKSNVSVRINSILLPNYLDNFDDCSSMIEFSKYLGADDIRFSEVQEQPDMFIDSKNIFSGLNKNPFVDGCEQKLDFKGINVYVKQVCGFVNSKKNDNFNFVGGCGEVITNPCGYKKEGVLYPDLTHSISGWINNNQFGCHGGCH